MYFIQIVAVKPLFGEVMLTENRSVHLKDVGMLRIFLPVVDTANVVKHMFLLQFNKLIGVLCCIEHDRHKFLIEHFFQATGTGI